MRKLITLLIAATLAVSCAEDGRNGVNGVDGTNGVDGVDGTPADGLYIIEVIDPCGDSRFQDEVLLRLSDGAIYAWYEDTGMVRLDNGNYITNDTERCRFTVLDGEVIY